VKKTNQIFLWLFICISTCLNVAKAQNFDYKTVKTLNTENMPAWDTFNEGVSFSVYPAMPLTVGGIWCYGHYKKDKEMKRNAWRSLATICGANGGSIILKMIIHRDRPYVTYPNDIVKRTHSGPYSFPSGHSAAAFATATSLSLSTKKWEVAVPSFLYAGLVGYSRMRLGVHYPSDVTAGAVIGIAGGIIVWKLDQWLFKKPASQGTIE